MKKSIIATVSAAALVAGSLLAGGAANASSGCQYTVESSRSGAPAIGVYGLPKESFTILLDDHNGVPEKILHGHLSKSGSTLRAFPKSTKSTTIDPHSKVAVWTGHNRCAVS